MRSSTRSSSSSLRAGPIHGDELEHDRIQLEHNLLHNTDLSLHLSSQPADSDREHNYDSSVEYPRHNSAPEQFGVNAFASFDGDNFAGDMDSHSQLHAWSYRTMEDDDEGINPYGGESMSTAAHHASALTLSAGLRGRGGGARRDMSLSGAEYDPERPLGAIIAGVDSRYSMFGDQSRSKSRYQAVSFDPLIVDDTSQLDRVLESGHTAITSSLAARLRPTVESATSESESDTSMRSNGRPKLSDALHRVATFSPKRPRAAAVQQPEVQVQPPTPGSSDSRFTKMAKGLARDIEAEQRSMWGAALREAEGEVSVMAQSTVRDRKKQPRAGASERNPFKDIGNSAAGTAKARNATPRTTKVHLPDVTGLTSAVASPARPGVSRHGYEGDNGTKQAETQFLTVLSAVQSKLAHLEAENGISRRRVRELERELETCKAEVQRERTRVMERESVIVQQREDSYRSRKSEKAKANKSARFEDDEVLEQRYREVVEEKKALEALITTLRAHLARLTSELSSHRELLSELRSLRESDARTLREKSVEVEHLRQEVERLAGEVEVLRGVVEEGLNERRAVREASTQVDDEDGEGHTQRQENRDDHREPIQEESNADETPLVNNPKPMNRTMRTDHATLGSSANAGMSTVPFIVGEELDRISLELAERRSDRSGASSSRSRLSDGGEQSLSRIRSRAPSPSLADQTAPSVSPPVSRPYFSEAPSRPSVPTLAQASRRSSLRAPKSTAAEQGSPSAPFPQIRGGHLEKLFFSAPEHNAKTCTVCHRRGRGGANSQSWAAKKHDRNTRARVDDADDEGFVEGPEHTDAKDKHHQHADPSRWARDAGNEGLPPQTVLARVLRELEDDFTHYKSIYLELAEQYGLMDAASNVSKRNVLADHLREVVDVLEQKGDQIASLYDLLSFQDKPVAESAVPNRTRPSPNEPSSWGRTRNLKRHPTFA
ncbi:hypothetical protein FIBSPDRAFT_849381 [Athelia psychrophila]|uniref:Cep57 centrosome microtubule-binding domain-containing protein n=1 Tax=Athelia psychrophila TaxID=1759441 RepID=A0A166U866_9AGAM|nr:hypothetical protein FIBSPDRAFT_849381 [Fibularhizoctonia sp. CBS 109695]